MKIDWKALARSEGYRSLKKALAKDVMEASARDRALRSKAEFYSLFNWVIARAKHYAHRQGVSVAEVLNRWEEGRDYWWLNRYGEYRQQKLPSGRPRNVRPMKSETHIKRSARQYDTTKLLDRLRHERRVEAAAARKAAGKPARWGAARKKKRAAYLRSIKEKNL